MKGLDKLKQEDLEAQLELLTEMDKVDKKNNGHSQGPTFDCVVFNDGEIWRYSNVPHYCIKVLDSNIR